MSAASAKILLYTAKVCPYAARAELALALAGIPHEKYEIDLLNKPSWYEEKINKASKVTTESSGVEFKLPESLVIVKYVNDLTSDSIFGSGATPKQRAVSRYIVERYSQLVQPHYVATTLRRDATALPGLKQALVAFNSLLKDYDVAEGRGKFILGAERFDYAELNIAPFVARTLSASKHGLLPEGGEGWKKIDEEVEKGSGRVERVKEW